MMKCNLSLITSALEFAATKHARQRRKGANSIPYVNHLIEVLNLLASTLSNPSTKLLVASILHDVIEDTTCSKKEIEDKFGRDVLDLVLEVTDDMKLTSKIRKQKQLETAPFLSNDAKCIKIADKTCNIKDILYTRIKWSKQRKAEYIIWAEKVVSHCKGISEDLDHKFDDIVNEAVTILGYKG